MSRKCIFRYIIMKTRKKKNYIIYIIYSSILYYIISKYLFWCTEVITWNYIQCICDPKSKLAIFNWWYVFNSLLRSHLWPPEDDETWFPGSCIIVHHKYKIINLCSKLLLRTRGLNGNSRSIIASAIRSVFAFRVTYIIILYYII